MKKIVIFYHSGAGMTKMIGEIFKEKLSENFEVDSIRIEKKRNDFNFDLIKDYDFLVFGFPVYGFHPSTSMQEFVDNIPVLNVAKKCFIYSTLAFVSGNSMRMLAKKLYEKNIIITGSVKIYSPATDAAIVLPSSWKFVRSFKKKTPDKIKKAISKINKEVNSTEIELNMTHFKKGWGLIEKIFSKNFSNAEKKSIKALRIGEERCVNCNHCVDVCSRGCIAKGDKHPLINKADCEFCLRCLHHCPNKAITFSKEFEDKPRFDKKFFNIEKRKLLTKIDHD